MRHFGFFVASFHLLKIITNLAVHNIYYLKAYSSMKPAKKSLVSLAGKLNLNRPYIQPSTASTAKIQIQFPAKETKDFLAGFIEK